MQHAGSEVADRLVRRMGDECLGVRVGRLHRLVGREFERRLRPLGLTLPQLEILSTLMACGGPARPARVADLLAVERSTMSRNLAVLQERGWVAASDSSASGRTLAAVVTAEGVAKVAEADEAWLAAQTALTARLGPTASTLLDGWLAALTARPATGATADADRSAAATPQARRAGSPPPDVATVSPSRG